VSLRRRQQRVLRRTERDLAASDPGLNAFFFEFTSRAGGCEMPRLEHVAPWPLRMLARPWRGRSVSERFKDWRAENWNEP
jgi:hypothetical protein